MDLTCLEPRESVRFQYFGLNERPTGKRKIQRMFRELKVARVIRANFRTSGPKRASYLSRAAILFSMHGKSRKLRFVKWRLSEPIYHCIWKKNHQAAPRPNAPPKMKASNITHDMLVDQLHWSILVIFYIHTRVWCAFRVYLVMLSGDKVVNTHRMLGVRPKMPGVRHFASLADFGRAAGHSTVF